MNLRKVLKGPKVNRVIKYFVMADLMLFGGWGFVAPIFSIFIIDEIEGGTLVVVGMSSAVYWIARSVIQPFIANKLDKEEGDKDDLYILMLGLVLVGITAFAFTLVKGVLALYVVQAVHGVAMGMYSTPWSAIFSRHLDRHRQAFDWSIDKATVGITVAFTSFIGGWSASRFGFDVTFIAAGVLSLVAAGIVFVVPDLVLPTPSSETKSSELQSRHRPPTTH